MRICFCKFGGMGNGGIEKYLQTLAILYKDHGHEVSFIYTNPAPLTHSSWRQPPNDDRRIKLMEDNGIKLIYVNVESRYYNEWVNSDFFDKFKESDYDFIVTGGRGDPEFPYNKLKSIKIIHTVHGWDVFNQENIHKSVLLCNWQAERWLNRGGDRSKLEIIPSIVNVPASWKYNLRSELGLLDKAFVYGLHQRNDESIAQDVSLHAFAQIQDDNSYYVILGGSNRHRDFVINNNIKNVIFLDYTSDTDIIHGFLEGIDVYAHCRSDGEVCSASIIEAMSHGKPIISSPGINMGHAEQLSGCGLVAGSAQQYASEMKRLQDKYELQKSSLLTLEKYNSTYKQGIVEQRFLDLLK